MKLLLIALLAAIVIPIGAQEAPQLTESIEIDLVNVDVTVTDRSGKRVYGLKRDDFRVYDDGKLQEITNFAEYRGDATAGSARVEAVPQQPSAADTTAARRPPVRVVVFVDNYSLTYGPRRKAIAEVKKFVRRALASGDEVSVVTWSESLDTILPFSGDFDRVDAALDESAGLLASGSQRDADERELRDRDAFRKGAGEDAAAISSPAAREAAARLDREFSSQQLYKHLRRTATAVNAVLTKMAGIDAKKVFVIVTEGFESNAAGLSSAGPADPLYDTSKFMRSIVETANSRGIVLYTVHARGLELPGGDVDVQEAPDPFSGRNVNAELMNSTLTLGLLSDSTGGRLVAAPSEMAKFFDGVREDLSSYYSIAYVNRSGKPDVRRKLRVETVNRDFIVRARDSAATRSDEMKLKDRLSAALFYGGETDDMHASVLLGKPKRTGRKEYLVPLEVRFPIGAMTFLRQGSGHAGGFSVYVTASDRMEDATPVIAKSQRLVIPQEKFEAAKKQLCVYTLDVKTRGVGGYLALAVRDELTGTLSIRRIELPVIQPQ